MGIFLSHNSGRNQGCTFLIIRSYIKVKIHEIQSHNEELSNKENHLIQEVKKDIRVIKPNFVSVDDL